MKEVPSPSPCSVCVCVCVCVRSIVKSRPLHTILSNLTYGGPFHGHFPFALSFIFIVSIVAFSHVGVDEAILLTDHRALTKNRHSIASLHLDVLVFPELGMGLDTYLLSFARLAKRQVMYWGHGITSGIGNVDYFLSSRLFESTGAAAGDRYGTLHLNGVSLSLSLSPSPHPPLSPSFSLLSLIYLQRKLLPIGIRTTSSIHYLVLEYHLRTTSHGILHAHPSPGTRNICT